MAISEKDLAHVLEQYTNAVAAHQECITALIDAMLSGAIATAELVDEERRTQEELNTARERLVFALTLARER